MDDRDSMSLLGIVLVRMSVCFGHTSVSCPARVSNADGSTQAFCHLRLFFKHANPTNRLANVQAMIHQTNSGRVIASILQALQTFQKDWHCLLATDIGDDSTHD